MEHFQAVSWTYTEPYATVQAYFFCFPAAEVTLNQLAATVKISKSSARKAVILLLKESFLKKKVIGRSWLLSCNQKHSYHFSRKIAYFLGLLLDSEMVNTLQRQYPSAKALVLFGSYRKGDNVEGSDIDLAVELVPETPLKIVDFAVFDSLGYQKNVPVRLHLFSRKKVTPTLFTNITNGIVLDGFLEVQP